MVSLSGIVIIDSHTDLQFAEHIICFMFGYLDPKGMAVWDLSARALKHEASVNRRRLCQYGVQYIYIHINL